ncbi:pdxK [Lepeophtheirus salmonis]|uniref:pyridoxal kinase n=1 Tax=Lepeophtheirus salmonis TaxID=72036 RepID=A0A7R8CY60_LEPSM|nr:pdxK [Lepeophtheirus salmonis]CAF2938488.1 pdxK [Lepeophtheirus salmonis]
MDNKRILSIQSHVVSGYVGNKSSVFPLQLLGFEAKPLIRRNFGNSFKKIVEVVKLLRKKCPNIEFVCDPVMGDIETGFYVPEELLDVYKSSVLPLADIYVVKALQMVHDIGVKTVILSSLEFKGTKSLTVYASSYKENRIFKLGSRLKTLESL